MKYYKVVNNGIIDMIGSGSKETTLFTPITEDKYKELQAKMQSKPTDTVDEKFLLEDESESYKAFETTAEEKIAWYTNAVVSGDMSLDDVPEEYKEDVQALLPKPQVNEDSLNKAYREGVNEA